MANGVTHRPNPQMNGAATGVNGSRFGAIVAAVLISLACSRSPAVAEPPTPAGAVVVVAEAGASAAFIRRTPGGAAIRGWRNGTEMTSLGLEVLAAGRTWMKVEDPQGNRGWVADALLAPRPAEAIARRLLAVEAAHGDQEREEGKATASHGPYS